MLPDNEARPQARRDSCSVFSRGRRRGARAPLAWPRAKGDIVDWAAAGGTPEQFHALVDRDARQWQAPEDEPFETDAMRETPALPPPPNRSSLLLSAWLTREIPPRDYYLGGVMCTTSRWFIFGETGVGKTLLGMMTWAARSRPCWAFLKCAGTASLLASCISTANCRADIQRTHAIDRLPLRSRYSIPRL